MISLGDELYSITANRDLGTRLTELEREAASEIEVTLLGRATPIFSVANCDSLRRVATAIQGRYIDLLSYLIEVGLRGTIRDVEISSCITFLRKISRNSFS